LHVVAHSLYKAHAFLASGSVIDVVRASWTPRAPAHPQPERAALGVLAAIAVAALAGRAFGITIADNPGAFTLSAVTALALAHLLSMSLDARPDPRVLARTALAAAAVATVSAGLQAAAAYLFAGTLARGGALHGPFAIALAATVTAAFAAITFFQGRVPGDGAAPRRQALYAAVANGFYVNTLVNRAILRWWSPQSAVGSAR
jgi:NAD(P)H-quinone oxidoreductase subunit 5